MKNRDILRTTLFLGAMASLALVMIVSTLSAAEQPKPASPLVASPPESSKVDSISKVVKSQPDKAGQPTPKQDGARQVAPGTAPPKPGSALAGAGDSPLRLYMPDGQLRSHIIRVYVNRDILPDQDPRLFLFRSHAVTTKMTNEDKPIEPTLVAPGQEWVESAYGQQVRRSGTLLLFDLSKIENLELKAMLRVMPMVQWKESDTVRMAVGAGEVNVGNIVAAVCWTTLIVGLALLIVLVLVWWAKGNPALLLAGVDGHLSLSQTQVACWTVVVGGVVLGYGLIRLTIPDIPASILVLMGTSLTTGGIAYFKDAQKQTAAGAAAVQRTLSWGDLVRNFTPGQDPELSLAKAQMLFWTVLLLVLFVSKSILDGAIWDVPWALVALMGFSQTGYLAPKLAPQV